jgi:hypothetical protein
VIEDQRADLDRRRLKVESELGVYREMLTRFNGSTALMDVPPATPAKPSPSAFAMSPTWITIFTALDKRGRSFDAAEVEALASGLGQSLSIPSIRSQFAHYLKRGYLKKVSRGKYMITPKGREKFAAAAESLAGEDPKENGLPKGSPETGVSAPNFNSVNGGKENA